MRNWKKQKRITSQTISRKKSETMFKKKISMTMKKKSLGRQ